MSAKFKSTFFCLRDDVECYGSGDRDNDYGAHSNYINKHGWCENRKRDFLLSDNLDAILNLLKENEEIENGFFQLLKISQKQSFYVITARKYAKVWVA